MDYRWTLRHALLIILLSGSVQSIQIEISSSHSLAVQGDQVDLVCRVTGASAGDLIYFVKQVTTSTDDVTVTEPISSNHILSPLYETFGRFEADVVDAGDVTLFQLSIKGVTQEDTGVYGCIDATTKISDATRVDIYKQAANVSFPDRAANEPYVFIEGEPQEVTCFVNDVVPVPDVQLYIDDTDYSDGFSKTSVEDIHCEGSIGTKDCPLHYNYDVTVTNPEFVAHYQDNGRMLFCESRMHITHHTLERVSARIPIVVKYSPKFHCDTVMSGSVGDSANITCSLGAEPLPHHVTWHFYYGGVHMQLDSGSSIDGYQAFEEPLPSGHDRLYTLHIEDVDAKHFTTYKLQTFQEIANKSIEITMNEHIVTTESPTDSAHTVIVTSWLLLLSVLSYLTL